MSDSDEDDLDAGRPRDYGTTTSAPKDTSRSRIDTEVGDDSVTSDNSSEDDEQEGVKAIEAIARTWSPWSLGIAYVGIGLIAICTSLEQNTTSNLTVIVTSYFGHQALISSVTLVQNVILAVVKPPMAKVSDVFGRLEAFTISVCLYMLGYLQQAEANSVNTFAAAQVFYSAGQTGLQILIQIFIADTTAINWRVLFSSLVYLPFLFTVWVGPVIAGAFGSRSMWRWGYGMWAMVLPVAFLPLATSLFLNHRKAKRSGYLKPRRYRGTTAGGALRALWYELDFFGLVLLCAAVSLILLPLTLAPQAREQWQNPSMVTMLIVGGVCLLAFAFWERSERLAPHAFFPRKLFQQSSVVAGVAWAFFYYMAYFLSIQPYFQSYLLVAQDLSLTTAGHVLQVFSFSSSIAAVVVGILVKRTGHYKYFITSGSCLYLLGIVLMIKYRSEGTSVRALVATQIVVGVGGGMANIPTQIGVQASASHQQVAAATAVYLTMLEMGGAVGSAISGAIWSSNILSKLERYLPEESKSQASTIYGSVKTAASYPRGTPERAAIDRAYQETMHSLLIVAVWICVIPVILSCFMKNHRLNEINQKVDGLVIGNHEQSGLTPETQPLNSPKARRLRARRHLPRPPDDDGRNLE